MLFVVLGFFVLFAALICVLFLQMKNRSYSLMKQEMDSMRSDFRENLNNLTTQVNERLKDNTSVLGERLDNTVRVVGTVREHLGRLHEASTRIFEIGKDISGLQELLRAPKIRGGLGEFFLEDLLSQVIPRGHYQMQYSFKSNQQVDAIIKLGERMVPIDSKFPLENFKAILASQNEEEKKVSRRQFITDVKKHVSDIASKYILPDEGTFDFAFMYIPAENVYYETIIKDEKFTEPTGLFQYSLNKRVIPVSPNSFYAYLQVILVGLKGMVLEKDTQKILANLERLKGDFDKLYEDFAKLGKHIDNSGNSYKNAEKRVLKIQEKVLHLSGLNQEKALPDEKKVGV